MAIDITAISRLKHADLFRAAKKLGSQAALARHLGVRQDELGKWINLNECPPMEPYGERWTEVYILELESKLIPLTGKSWEELFPEELRQNYKFLLGSKTFEKTASIESYALESYAARTSRRLEYKQGETDEDEDKKMVFEYLGKLPERQRLIIEMRIGINGGGGKTLEEIGDEFKITKERVRQIETRGYRQIYSWIKAEKMRRTMEIEQKRLGLDK